MAELDGAGSDLDRWLEPFLKVLGHKKRRTWAPMYLRGLLGPSERKSLQPMAACLGLPGHDQLQHFVASPAWDDAALWRVLAERADRLVGGPGAVLVIDDTALPKKGTLSVGVARQYCGQLGKKASCQALVSLTLAGKEVPMPVGLRLFLPERWTGDPERCAAAGVPEAGVVARSKGEIALAELPWRRVTWRRGTKGPLVARFAATRVRVADGATWANNRHLPGEEVWLVGEWRPNGERKYYLSNLPPRTSLRALAAAIKARWVCEQAQQQLKQELGLAHFEGRSCTGLHRHAPMTCIAFAHLQHLRLAGQRPTGSGKNAAPSSGTATITEPAGGAPRHHGAAVRRSRRADPLPALQTKT